MTSTATMTTRVRTWLGHDHRSKVPEVTAGFWLAKSLTTAWGEATSDFMVKHLAPVLAVAIGGIAFAIALLTQFRADRYVAWIYWLAVSMVGVFGTMAADVLHVGLGIPYLAASIGFAIVLAAVFVCWQHLEGTLSIHSIVTPRRELFYWAAVCATFALGTALGDMTAKTLGIGYFSSIFLFAGLIAIPAIGYWKFHLNAILAFWSAYVLTRPLGASVADWLGQPTSIGGTGIGTGWVSLVFGLAIIGLVVFFSVTKDDVEEEHPRPHR